LRDCPILNTHRPTVTDWALVGTGDVEAFLARIDNPGYRARQLHALQVFFRFARQHRHILADPTRRLNANSNKPFHGRVLDLPDELRWFTPHSCRRTVATVVKEAYGADAAQAQLSHAKLATTEGYFQPRTIGPDAREGLDRFAAGEESEG